MKKNLDDLLFKSNVDAFERIANNIRMKRLSKNLSIEKLADMAGITPAFLGNIERREKKPSMKTIMKIAKALKTSPANIIGRRIYYNPIPKEEKILFDISNLLRNKNEEELKKIYNIIKNL